MGRGVAIVDTFFHPDFARGGARGIEERAEGYSGTDVAIGCFPRGAVAIAVGRDVEAGEMAVPAGGFDVDDHFLVGGEALHGVEGIEAVGIATPAPVEMESVLVVETVENEGVAARVADTAIKDGTEVSDFVADGLFPNDDVVGAVVGEVGGFGIAKIE